MYAKYSPLVLKFKQIKNSNTKKLQFLGSLSNVNVIASACMPAAYLYKNHFDKNVEAEVCPKEQPRAQKKKKNNYAFLYKKECITC